MKRTISTLTYKAAVFQPHKRYIGACIFDLDGTTVGKYGFGTLQALKAAFRDHGADVPFGKLRQEMGICKRTQIDNILKDEHIYDQVMSEIGHSLRINDGHVTISNRIYQRYLELQMANIKQHSKVIPGVVETMNYMRSIWDMKFGMTTGYPKMIADEVLKNANEQGLKFDSCVASDEVNLPRPHYQQIMKNLDNLKFYDDPKHVMKIGDTIIDIKEGYSAGCLTVGVTRTSSMMNFDSPGQAFFIERDAPAEYQKRVDKVRQAMLKAGADYVIDDIRLLPLLMRNAY